MDKRSMGLGDPQLNTDYSVPLRFEKHQWTFSRMVPTCPETNCKMFFAVAPHRFRWNPLVDMKSNPAVKPSRPDDGASWGLSFSDEFTEPEINVNRWKAVDRNRGSQAELKIVVWLKIQMLTRIKNFR